MIRTPQCQWVREKVRKPSLAKRIKARFTKDAVKRWYILGNKEVYHALTFNARIKVR